MVINLDARLRETKMAAAQAAVVQLLEAIGYELEDNPHLADTPRRVAETFIELTSPAEFNFTTFDNPMTSPIEQLVAVTDIDFTSLCAHHLLPFRGVAHVAYIPNLRVAGLSKLARAVELFARGLNTQEEMTQNIGDFLQDSLDPLGVAVIVRAEHQCMSIRGVTKPGSMTVTSVMKGVFLDPSKDARQEFLSLVHSNGRH